MENKLVKSYLLVHQVLYSKQVEKMKRSPASPKLTHWPVLRTIQPMSHGPNILPARDTLSFSELKKIRSSLGINMGVKESRPMWKKREPIIRQR